MLAYRTSKCFELNEISAVACEQNTHHDLSERSRSLSLPGWASLAPRWADNITCHLSFLHSFPYLSRATTFHFYFIIFMIVEY
jgi:hypothetical protein